MFEEWDTQLPIEFGENQESCISNFDDGRCLLSVGHRPLCEHRSLHSLSPCGVNAFDGFRQRKTPTTATYAAVVGVGLAESSSRGSGGVGAIASRWQI